MSLDTLEPVDEAVRMIWAHRTVLQSVITLILRNPHLVEDAFSDATLAMIKAWGQFDRSRPFKPWAVAIARNTALQKLRDDRRELITSTALESFAEEVASSGDEPHREACLVALERCVDRLPPRHRKLVRCRYYKRHGYDRLAARFGKTVGALQCILFRLHHDLSECVLRELRDP